MGTIDQTTLAEAIEKAEFLNLQIQAGVDLHAFYKNTKIKRERQEKKLANVTVEQLLLQYVAFNEKRGHWKSRRKSQPLIITGWMKNHFSKEFLQLDIKKLSPERIAEEFHGLWMTHTSTPEKIIALMSAAFEWAMRRRLVFGGVNLADATSVRELLPHDRLRPKASHHPFLPPELMPDFMVDVLNSESVAAKCLAFQIFCALRIDNAVNARWSQIDFEMKTLTIPREEMKVHFTNDPPHIVPLSDAAIRVLHSVPRFFDQTGCPVDYVFASPAMRCHKPISERSVYNIIADFSLRRKEQTGTGWIDPSAIDRQGRQRIVVPHGLARTDFESWALDPVTFGHEDYAPLTIDFIMDHKVDSLGRAYKRRPPLGAMREVLDAWANYLTSGMKR